MKFLRQFGYMNDNWYNYCVWMVRHGLPAFGTLYYMLSKTWGINHTTEVLGTLAAIETFLGVCLGISSENYKEGLKAPEEASEIALSKEVNKDDTGV